MTKYHMMLRAQAELLMAARVIAKSSTVFDKIKADRMEKLRDAVKAYEAAGGTYSDSPPEPT